jgi:hypothetical protein
MGFINHIMETGNYTEVNYINDKKEGIEKNILWKWAIIFRSKLY